MAHYSIDDARGNQITAGLQPHEANATAQREANARGETVYLYSGSEEPEAVHPRLRIYRRHDGIQEWAATAELRAGELVPLSGGLRDEDAWDLIEQAVQDGDLRGEVIASDGTVYTYEAQ